MTDTSSAEHLWNCYLQARQGDWRAWTELVNAHSKHLRSFLASKINPKLQSRFDQSDVLSEISMRAPARCAADEFAIIEKIVEPAKRESELRSFLLMCTERRVADLVRKNQSKGRNPVNEERGTPSDSQSDDDLRADHTSPEERAVLNEQWQRVDDVIRCLDAEQQIIMELYLSRSWPTKREFAEELSAHLHISVDAAAKRFQRLLKLLKDSI